MEMMETALNPTERELKRLFLSHPSLDLQSPHPMGHFLDILPAYTAVIEDREGAFPTNRLLTESPFLQGSDIAINQHMRYMPPFLHGHTFFETIFVAHGACVNHISGNRLEMQAGNICIIAPYTDHALGAFSDDAIIYNLVMRPITFHRGFLDIMPKGSILYSFFENILNSKGKDSFVLFRSPEDAQLRTVFTEMVRVYDARSSYYNSLISLLSGLFFVQLLSKYERDIVLSEALDRHQQDIGIVQIFRYITEHLQSVTLTELSGHFGYSERQMARILNTYTGKNFVELVRLERLTKAAELLKNPEIAVHDAAEMVGYPNYKYFHRLFCEQYQKTPVQFRKAILSVE